MADISDMDEDKLSALIAANLASLLVEKGLKATRLGLDAGLSRSAVGDIIARRAKSPTYATLVKLAETAGVPVERITIGPQPERLSAEERHILDLLAQLPEPLRRKLLGYGEGLLDAADRGND